MIKNKIKSYIKNQPKFTRRLLGFFIKLHNYSYKKITEYATNLNGGINPKHKITKYHDYFTARINPGDTILDIGCGGGLLACDVAKKAKKVVGIDISDQNIDYAKKHYQKDNLEFIVGDATVYHFNNHFDKLILSNVLEHIEDRINLLKKIGFFGDTLLLRVPMITREWVAVYKRDNGYPYKLDDTHYLEYTLEDVEKETKESGWEIESYQINWGEFWSVLKQK
jgi:SAM-dependent methyltransferase